MRPVSVYNCRGGVSLLPLLEVEKRRNGVDELNVGIGIWRRGAR